MTCSTAIAIPSPIKPQPLFAIPSRAAEAVPLSEAEELLGALKATHPDEMSPREALEALYALKAKLPK